MMLSREAVGRMVKCGLARAAGCGRVWIRVPEPAEGGDQSTQRLKGGSEHAKTEGGIRARKGHTNT